MSKVTDFTALLGLKPKCGIASEQENKGRILLVEDQPSQALIFCEYLFGGGYSPLTAATGRDALELIDKEPFDAVILDLKLPDMDGLRVLETVRQGHPLTPVIMVTAHGEVNTAVEAIKLGAHDFLIKPVPHDRLLLTLKRALEHFELSRELQRLKGTDSDRFCSFIGASPEMRAVYRTIETAAQSKASVFITGESGTGKELAAEAIHQLSPRNSKPFVTINCAAIPKDLLESGIFGHVKGAFTGATMDREGAASTADQGTLFLDEICEMAPDLLAKILRFTQTGSFQRVGSSRTETVDIRFVCATNRNPLDEMNEGRFREDLYYRLYVLPIHLPALRERKNDPLVIARHFLREFAQEERKELRGFSPEVEQIIQSFPWPGNVRQLQNVIRNIVVLNNGPVVTLSMLPHPLNTFSPSRLILGRTGPTPKEQIAKESATASQAPEFEETDNPPIRPLALIEKEAIEEALRRTRQDVPQAAALLKVNPSTIYRKLRQWDTPQNASSSDFAEGHDDADV